jgi:hypothetical protein
MKIIEGEREMFEAQREGHVWRVSRRDGLRALFALGLATPLLFARRGRSADCKTSFIFNSQGPFYLGDARDDEPTGNEIALVGTVNDAVTCAPIAGAQIIRWHTNKHGIYDEYFNTKLVCDADGHYAINTIVPGEHNGVPRHVHFMVTAPGYAPLTTRWQCNDDAHPSGEIPFSFALTKSTG